MELKACLLNALDLWMLMFNDESCPLFERGLKELFRSLWLWLRAAHPLPGLSLLIDTLNGEKRLSIFGIWPDLTSSILSCPQPSSRTTPFTPSAFPPRCAPRVLWQGFRVLRMNAILDLRYGFQWWCETWYIFLRDVFFDLVGDWFARRFSSWITPSLPQ